MDNQSGCQSPFDAVIVDKKYDRMISIVVTTHGRDTLYTGRCLERIASWKSRDHQLIVVVHDESPLLGTYLNLLRERGVIDVLVHAGTAHGHVRGVNLGLLSATGRLVFNVNTDVRVGPGVIERVVAMFDHNPRLGLVGWHYNWGLGHDGTFWRSSRRIRYTVRLRENLARRPGYVDLRHMENIRTASWATGRVIRAAGDRRLLCANTSFFAMPRNLWRRIGGLDERRYPHLWSDDYLCYAVLDQQLDIANLPPDIRCSQRPSHFNALSDLAWEPAGESDRHRDLLSEPRAGSLDSLERKADLLNLVTRRLDMGARALIIGAGKMVPPYLARRRFSPPRRSSLQPDVDYVLVDAGAATHGVLERLQPGGAVLRFTGGHLTSIPVPSARTVFARDRHGNGRAGSAR